MEHHPSGTFVLFGATGDLAVKKIFPALEALFLSGNLDMPSKIVAVSRRDWDASDFVAFLEDARGSAYDPAFVSLIAYARVDIEAHSGYDGLAGLVEGDATVYLSLAPQYHKPVIENLVEERILVQGSGKILIEKPFGVDEASARSLNDLLSEVVNEEQVYRIDHYLGKDALRAIMDIHERTPAFDRLLTAEHVASIRVNMFEDIGIFGRGASYDKVGAFRDIGQNHVLEMLAVLVADVPDRRGAGVDRGHVWQAARAGVLSRLEQPAGTCDLLRRGQYDGYLSEVGIAPDSQTETAFEVITSFTSGKLAGVPVSLRGGKRMPSSEARIDVLFRDSLELPQSVVIRLQPAQEIVTTERDGSSEVFEVPRVADAYVNVLGDAFAGRVRDFVGVEEVRSLWRFSDRVVGCWDKVPLETYGEGRPFLVE